MKANTFSHVLQFYMLQWNEKEKYSAHVYPARVRLFLQTATAAGALWLLSISCHMFVSVCGTNGTEKCVLHSWKIEFFFLMISVSGISSHGSGHYISDEFLLLLLDFYPFPESDVQPLRLNNFNPISKLQWWKLINSIACSNNIH